MGEPRIINVTAGLSHHMLFLGIQTNAITGEEWELFECPECGYLCKMQWEPYRSEILRYGDGMVTPEEAEEFSVLAKTPAGRVKIEKRLASVPKHSYIRVPTLDELRSTAEHEGRLEEFEKSVDDAIVSGKPLFTFGIGDNTASVWPPGGKPK